MLYYQRVLIYFILSIFLGTSNSYSSEVPSSQPQTDANKSKLDKLILKAYSAAENLFSPEAKAEDEKLPRILIKTANEVTKEEPAKEEPILEDLIPDQEEKNTKLPIIEPIKAADDKEEENVGGIKALILKRQEQLNIGTDGFVYKATNVDTLYWEKIRHEYMKKREAERLAKERENKILIENKYKAETKDGVPIIKKKPEHSYKTEKLPSAISKKTYDNNNSHLPPVMYEGEYKNILFNAAAIGDLDKLKAMIEYFGTTEVRDNEGNTPLIYAIMAQSTNAVEALIIMGASVNVQNNFDVSPLYAATNLRRIDYVEQLLKRGADVDMADNYGRTPLMIAAKNDAATISEMLIESGAQINKKMSNGDTALHIAAQNNSFHSSYVLITKGADTELRNNNGQTPLMLASAAGSNNITGILLKAGADLNKQDIYGRSPKILAEIKGHLGVAQLIETEAIKRGFIAQQILLEAPYKGEQPNTPKTKTTPIPIGKPVIKDNVPSPYFSKDELSNM